MRRSRCSTHPFLASVTTAVLVLAVACTDSGTPAGLPMARPQFAKPTGKTIDTHPRANLLWDDLPGSDGTPTAGIRGDRRDRFGSPAALTEYQGADCGVRGIIYDGRGESGNIDVDTDTDYTTDMSADCGERRNMLLYVGDDQAIGAVATTIYPHLIMEGVWSVPTGQTADRRVTFGLQGLGPACVLAFDGQYPGATSARVTGLPTVQVMNANGDLVTARQWRVESQGNHLVACLKPSKGGRYPYADSGVRYYLPFAATVTAVPYPYETYP